MQIIIVSGFLGSGKTTFIEEFQKRLSNVAILENDYAKANVDFDILSNTGKEIISLEEGCICCSRQKDFATTVITIENTIDPDYLIIEPTGVGYLSNVIRNIKAVEYEKIRLLNPITIVDYNSIDTLLKTYQDLFLDQIKNSRYLLLSKIENVSEEKIREGISRLEKLTDAKIFANHYRTFDDSNWQELLSPYDLKLDYNFLKDGLKLDNFTYENVKFKDFNDLGTKINAVASNRFGKLIRAKGIVDVSDKKVRVDVVGSEFDIVKYEGESSKNSLIFIGEDLEKDSYDILFKNTDIK